MRDQHWEQCHQEGQKTISFPQTPDEDEIQPLLFDLVRADRVELFKRLLPQYAKCKHSVKLELFKLAAGSGSTAMVDLARIDMGSKMITGGAAAIKANNIETFRHLLRVCKGRNYSLLIPEILNSESEEFRQDWEIYVDAEYETWNEIVAPMRGKRIVPFGDRYTHQSILKAAKGVPENEAFILLLWKKVNLAKNLTPVYLGDALVTVATTCCSMKMAKYLIDAGAPVNHRRSSSYWTPLHRAVTHDTSEAAELVKFLLCMGADPTAFTTSIPGRGSKIRRIRDEAGAKGISKWLGVSWDDLVQNIERGRIEAERSEKGDAELAL
jgi:hypothetical protein